MLDEINRYECVSRFISDETGQDLVEYSLLMAFVALAGAAAILGMSSSVNSSRLAAPNSLPSSGS
jgi:Flp pilus assembly pilin Flp